MSQHYLEFILVCAQTKPRGWKIYSRKIRKEFFFHALFLIHFTFHWNFAMFIHRDVELFESFLFLIYIFHANQPINFVLPNNCNVDFSRSREKKKRKTFEFNLISQWRGKVNILCILEGIWPRIFIHQLKYFMLRYLKSNFFSPLDVISFTHFFFPRTKKNSKKKLFKAKLLVIFHLWEETTTKEDEKAERKILRWETFSIITWNWQNNAKNVESFFRGGRIDTDGKQWRNNNNKFPFLKLSFFPPKKQTFSIIIKSW